MTTLTGSFGSNGEQAIAAARGNNVVAAENNQANAMAQANTASATGNNQNRQAATRSGAQTGKATATAQTGKATATAQTGQATATAQTGTVSAADQTFIDAYVSKFAADDKDADKSALKSEAEKLLKSLKSQANGNDYIERFASDKNFREESLKKIKELKKTEEREKSKNELGIVTAVKDGLGLNGTEKMKAVGGAFAYETLVKIMPDGPLKGIAQMFGAMNAPAKILENNLSDSKKLDNAVEEGVTGMAQYLISSSDISAQPHTNATLAQAQEPQATALAVNTIGNSR